MVTEMVVKEALTESMISAGAELTSRLDEAGLPLTASLWFYDSDANDWRFIIATPEVDSEGVRAAYGKVQSIIEKTPEDKSIPLKHITVVDPHDPTISVLRLAVRTGDGISRIRFSRNMINSTFIEDAYIYRLT
ncbi:MAG TPA: hypothetical protein VFZ40_16975 [Pyrinomonadaceae bacterium]